MALLPSCLLGLAMTSCREGEGSLYDHQMTILDGSRNVSLSEYSGKVVMLVNVATYWGFASQYPDLNALRSAYDGDLEILCVPSSNFFNVRDWISRCVSVSSSETLVANGFCSNCSRAARALRGPHRDPQCNPAREARQQLPAGFHTLRQGGRQWPEQTLRLLLGLGEYVTYQQPPPVLVVACIPPTTTHITKSWNALHVRYCHN